MKENFQCMYKCTYNLVVHIFMKYHTLSTADVNRPGSEGKTPLHKAIAGVRMQVTLPWLRIAIDFLVQI